MKRFLVLLAACVFVSSLSSGSAAVSAQNRALDFTLVNKTGLVITELYLSPSKSDEWGSDVLGRDVLKDGEKADITFSPKANSCRWDMKVVDEDDDDVVWEALNLCEANEIALFYKQGKPTAEIK